MPLFKPTDLNAGYWVLNSETTLTEKGAEKARILPAKSILVTCIGATIGKTGLSQVEGATNQQINALVPSIGHVVSEYLYFAFISRLLQDQVLSNASSTTLPILNKSKFSQIKIPLPPLNEQRRIVEKIEELFTKLDAGVRSLEQVQVLLKSYRRSVLKAAVEGELSREWREAYKDGLEPASELLDRIAKPKKVRRGVPHIEGSLPTEQEAKVPSKWTLVSVAELLRRGALIDVKDGNHGSNHPKKDDFSGEGLPFITATQVKRFRIDYETAPKLTGAPLAKLRLGFAIPGDVILTHKGSIGRVAVSTRNCVLSPQTTYYRVNSEAIYNSYLAVVLASPVFYRQLALVKSQTIRDFVSIAKQYYLLVPLPPLEEQRFIFEEVERRLSVVDKLEATVEANLKQAAGLRRSILEQAFCGELVPQDPDDEPASVLLERIREERQATKQKANKERRRRTGPGKRNHAEQGGLF